MKIATILLFALALNPFYANASGTSSGSYSTCLQPNGNNVEVRTTADNRTILGIFNYSGQDPLIAQLQKFPRLSFALSQLINFSTDTNSLNAPALRKTGEAQWAAWNESARVEVTDEYADSGKVRTVKIFDTQMVNSHARERFLIASQTYSCQR